MMLSTDSGDSFLSGRKSGRTFRKRSNSIKNLISFYETTYGKKKDSIPSQDRIKTDINNGVPTNNRFQRHISSPPIGHSNILNFNSDNSNKYLNISPPSSPGFSPSSSSSSSSSSERLSFYNNSFSTVESSNKKESCRTKDIQTPGMLWSISRTSSSSGFSSEFSSPSQSEASTPLFNVEEEAKQSTHLTTQQSAPQPETEASKSNNQQSSTKKTTSFNDLANILIAKQQKLVNFKFKNTSLNKLFDSAKIRSNSSNSVTREKKQTTTTTDRSASNHRQTKDKNVFQSIKKVLHTVKLCKLDKFPQDFVSPEPIVTHETLNATIVEEEVLEKSVNLIVKDVPVLKSLDSKTPVVETKVVDNSIPELTNLVEKTLIVTKCDEPCTANKQALITQSIKNKSTYINESFAAKKPPLHSSISMASAPTWSQSLSTSYSFSSLSRPQRSQSQKFTSSVQRVQSQRRFDPRTTQKIVLEWCKESTKNYSNVKINNFSSSWSDGLAFCALLHNFMPDAFDYGTLRSHNRSQNFELAFDIAYKKAGIMPLLEVNDMLNMGSRPDDRCVFTYISTIYSRFQNRSKTANMTNKSTINSSQTEIEKSNLNNNNTKTKLNNSLSLRE